MASSLEPSRSDGANAEIMEENPREPEGPHHDVEYLGSSALTHRRTTAAVSLRRDRGSSG